MRLRRPSYIGRPPRPTPYRAAATPQAAQRMGARTMPAAKSAYISAT